jgi:tight adherence protein B
MPEFLRDTPPWGIALGLLLLVVIGVIILSVVVLGIAGLFRRPGPTDGPSMAELAEPLLRARRGVGRMDASFDRLAEGTQLGLTGETATGWILLGGAVAAAAVYLATFDELLALGAAILGGGVVYLFFWTLQNRRRRAIQEQLPDGCFQLSRSLRSGLNLPAGLRETAAYVPSPLSGLFNRLSVALSLGETTRGAVRRVADDAAVTEFDLVTEVIALNSESGGNLPAMLDRLANSIRDRNQYRGYFRSVTTLARVAAIFLALAAPAAFLLYWILPDQRQLLYVFLNMPEGRIMLAVAIALEILGVIWIAVLLRRQDDY